MRAQTRRTKPVNSESKSEDTRRILIVHRHPSHEARPEDAGRRQDKLRMQPPKMRPATRMVLATMFLVLAQTRISAQGQSIRGQNTQPGASEAPTRMGPSESKLSGHREFQAIQKPIEALRAKRSDIEAEQPDESRPEVSVATRPTNSDELELVSRGETAGATNSRPAPSHHVNSKLQIVRLFAPDSIQNGTQDVTIDCMFKHDRKLDQRLAIKWFFNDELEPIYQWIPELNGRVYSKRYEHLIDKQYQVTEDVDFMLQAYKWLLGSDVDSLERDWDQVAAEGRLNLLAKNLVPIGSGGGGEQQQQAPDEQQVAATRKLLANKLSRLAKLGGDHSRQLIATLRTALAMDDQDVSRFRALRLMRPGVEMSGRFTCSISSLDGDDLKSTRLTVYEPPRSFTFNVSKTSSHSYNLTCQAGPTFPRPSIALYRYRSVEARPSQLQSSGGDDSRRLKSAPTGGTRQELLPGTQVQLQISARRPSAPGRREKLTESGSNGLPRINLDLEDELTNSLQPIADEAEEERKVLRRIDSNDTKQPPGGPFEVSAWALVDEASLNNNLVTEFECVVSLEGANYELRQTLALQRGWHVNSSPLTAKTTLVGLMSILASLLCLTVALVSTVLIFKLLRRHASKSGRLHGHSRRVSPRKSPSSSSDRGQSNSGCETASSSSSSASPSTSPSDQSTTGTVAPGEVAGLPRRASDQQRERADGQSALARGQLDEDSAMRIAAANHFGQKALAGGRALATRHVQPQAIYSTHDLDEQQFSDGIYRVPESRSSFGTRYATGLSNQQQFWSGPYTRPSDAGSQQAGARYSFSAHPDAEMEGAEQRVEVGDLHHNGQAAGFKLNHYQSNGIVTPASRGMPPGTNQLGGQKAQLRATASHQAASTISVNGKQLYC